MSKVSARPFSSLLQSKPEGEDIISFDEKTDDATHSSTNSQEGSDMNDLFLNLDTQPHGDPTDDLLSTEDLFADADDLFADVSLTDSGETTEKVNASKEETG